MLLLSVFLWLLLSLLQLFFTIIVSKTMTMTITTTFDTAFAITSFPNTYLASMLQLCRLLCSSFSGYFITPNTKAGQNQKGTAWESPGSVDHQERLGEPDLGTPLPQPAPCLHCVRVWVLSLNAYLETLTYSSSLGSIIYRPISKQVPPHTNKTQVITKQELHRSLQVS